MEWNKLQSSEQLKEIITLAQNETILIFKHSIRCPISSMALSRLEANWDDSSNIKPYYLDLINYRELSNEVGHRLNVEHQSPQAILLKDGVCVYHASHGSISFKEMLHNS